MAEKKLYIYNNGEKTKVEAHFTDKIPLDGSL